MPALSFRGFCLLILSIISLGLSCVTLRVLTDADVPSTIVSQVTSQVQEDPLRFWLSITVLSWAIVIKLWNQNQNQHDQRQQALDTLQMTLRLEVENAEDEGVDDTDMDESDASGDELLLVFEIDEDESVHDTEEDASNVPRDD